MARNKTKIKSTSDETDETIDLNGDDEDGEVVEAAAPTKEEARTLLAAYIETDNNVTKLEEQVDVAKKTRSEAVKEIYDKLGKGPFSFKGTYLGKIVKRDDVYFFRGRGDTELVSFD